MDNDGLGEWRLVQPTPVDNPGYDMTGGVAGYAEASIAGTRARHARARTSLRRSR
jgi:hypothetical protein